MQRDSIQAVLRTLNAAAVRYLIAGGLAVVAHGYLRFTADVDLILDLEEGNVRRALAALTGLGYRPRPPVPMEQFADPSVRDEWRKKKGLTAFSLYSPAHTATEVDLFVDCPLDFERAYASALRLDIAPDVPATFVGYDDLVALKRQARRPQDLLDLEQLRIIHDETI
ncbi:MAG: hypothetical protein ACREC3_15425 [Methyloceanibacter sp.]